MAFAHYSMAAWGMWKTSPQVPPPTLVWNGPPEFCGMKTRTGEPLSVLIADDDPSAREALRDIVEPEGFRTLLAADGEEAVDMVRVTTVHIVLLDMHMPKLTGLEVLQLVHQINSLVPGILVTADANEELIRQAFTVRAYSVIPKPVSKNVLLYTMVRALMKVYGHLLHDDDLQP